MPSMAEKLHKEEEPNAGACNQNSYDGRELALIAYDPDDADDQCQRKRGQYEQSSKDSDGIASARAENKHADDRREADAQKHQCGLAVVHQLFSGLISSSAYIRLDGLRRSCQSSPIKE